MTQTLPAGGTVAPGFEGVRAAFLEAQAADRGGAQLCIYQHGRRVVDLWAGSDPANERAYGETTLGVLMSCTKGVVATAAHMLAQRGQLDFDAPAARYWPEFAEGGKGEITVRTLMSHAGGLMGYDPETGMGAAEQFDWERSVSTIAAMEPLWTPGTAALYHFITFGVLTGEIIRRIDGRTPGRFVAEEIAQPLGLDLWIGLPEAQESRLAPHFNDGLQVSPEQWKMMLAGMGIDVDSRLVRTFLATVVATDGAIGLMNTSRAARAAELPAGNAVGDARSLAKFYAALIGEVGGVRLLSAEAVERARAPQTAGIGPPPELARLAQGAPQPFALGFELPSAVKPMLGPGSFGHSGAGGRMGFAHPEHGIALGYVCNTMLNSMTAPDPRWVGWTKALNESLAHE
ncbi:MAG: serine hydrolase domain-containing protein [Caulobacterales bacterium]